jgi:Zn-dependent peptidase ImmA (M78 family)
MIIIRYRYREQREFGIPSDIYHSGFKRTYKKWIGIARKKLAKNLYNKSDAIVKEINQERETIKNLPKIENNEIEIKLLDYAKSLGIDVVIENKGKNYFNLQNKMIHLNSETYDIATLAHEIGHAINSTYSTDELIGIISELDNEENFRYKHDNLNKFIKFIQTSSDGQRSSSL